MVYPVVDDDVNWYFNNLEGKKLEAIKLIQRSAFFSHNPLCAYALSPKDGSFTLQFKSAVAFGKAEIVTEDEKIHGLERSLSVSFLNFSTERRLAHGCCSHHAY